RWRGRSRSADERGSGAGPGGAGAGGVQERSAALDLGLDLAQGLVHALDHLAVEVVGAAHELVDQEARDLRGAVRGAAGLGDGGDPAGLGEFIGPDGAVLVDPEGQRLARLETD